MLKATYVGRAGRLVALGQTFPRGVAVEVGEATAAFLRGLDPAEYPVEFEGEPEAVAAVTWTDHVPPAGGEEMDDEPEGDPAGVTEEDSNV